MGRFSKYWDLYVLYVKNCERENYINDVDPNHYKMEWNHFWPQSIFGDWPVGQWLTLKQHAIVTALQTLVFKRNCLCSWHKKHLPPNLLELAWPYYRAAMRMNGAKGISVTLVKKDENGKSVNAIKGNKAVHAEKDENGKSVFAVKGGMAAAVIMNKIIHPYLGLVMNLIQLSRTIHYCRCITMNRIGNDINLCTMNWFVIRV
jgi:hypothetical protein